MRYWFLPENVCGYTARMAGILRLGLTIQIQER